MPAKTVAVVEPTAKAPPTAVRAASLEPKVAPAVKLRKKPTAAVAKVAAVAALGTEAVEPIRKKRPTGQLAQETGEAPIADPAEELKLRKAAPAEEPKLEEPAAVESPAEAAPEEPPPAQSEAAPKLEEPAQVEPPAEADPAEQPPAQPEAAPAEEPAQAEPAEEPQAAPADDSQPAELAPVEEPKAEQPAQAEPLPEAPAEQPDEPKPAKKRAGKGGKPSSNGATEAAPREQPADAGSAEPAQTEAPQAEEPVEARPSKQRRSKAGTDPAETMPVEQLDDASEKPADAVPVQKRGSVRQANPDQPVEAEAPPNDGKAAPVLDSQKERPRKGGDRPRRDGKRPATGEAAGRPARVVPAGPPPTDDSAAQEAAQPRQIEPVNEEQGRRRDRSSNDDGEPRRRERPQGSEVLREIGNRLIIQFDDQVMVESNDRPRMSRDAREVYYEDLPRGRVRETIVRRDGTQVVTVRNAYGDVIRRARIAPDGREYVLAYVDGDNYDRVDDWRDPGDDLPPMELDVPVDEYIMDATTAEAPDAYYDFLEQPPVERVERLYSVDEVKRSARIRDKTRRIDLDTLTFEFGSDSIPEDQIQKLDSVAKAIEKVLARNPAETFLIEGHTDAVGSDLANLALSDRRAEAVANALTDVFAIPPENLATQGYGEEYLKVRTQDPERENRRVAIRRITPLVAPVASAN